MKNKITYRIEYRQSGGSWHSCYTSECRSPAEAETARKEAVRRYYGANKVRVVKVIRTEEIVDL